jgi:hypothetical protein
MTDIPHQAVASPDVTVQDTDCDGMADGLELLIGTDPFSADTDRDGLNDGEELRLGRNPRSAEATDQLTDVSQLAQRLGSFQGGNYAFAVEPGLVAITALDGRPGINGAGLIYQQYGDAVVAQLRQQDLNNFAQVQQHLAQFQNTDRPVTNQSDQSER